MASSADWFRDGGTPISAERLHLTLFILPDFADAPADLLGRLAAVSRAVSAAPFELALNSINGSGRSIALRPQHRNAGMVELRDAITRLCPSYGIPERPEYSFSPHVTLGYCDGRPFGQRVTPTVWTASDFVLIHSHVGLTRHDEIGRWPLGSGAPVQGRLL